MPDVTFFSDQFSTTPAPDAINEMLGHDLAAWASRGLAAAGFDVGEVIAEDYGYGFWLRLDESHYWLTGTQYETEDGPVWLIGVHDDAGCLGGWWRRRRSRPDAPARIAQALHALLVHDDTITGITWWADGVGQGTPSAAPPAVA
jgi:hypothetical protein